MPVIHTEGLEKRFGTTVALGGLDLTVNQGEVHGFLGPNGSGKSTTIRILLGLLSKDAGTATVLGMDPWADAAELHRKMAYVPDNTDLWPHLSGGEAIDLLGRMRGGLDQARRNELIEQFKLDPTKRFSTYSSGNRQKVALISALAAETELLLLDEPTGGLDPLMESVFRKIVRDRADNGTTVLLSSHILSEVEAMADHVTIIRGGVTVESGSLTELRHLTRTSIDATTKQEPSALSELAGVHNVVIDDNRITAQVDTASLDGFMEALAPLGVDALTSAPPTLEELFIRHYEDTEATVS